MVTRMLSVSCTPAHACQPLFEDVSHELHRPAAAGECLPCSGWCSWSTRGRASGPQPRASRCGQHCNNKLDQLHHNCACLLHAGDWGTGEAARICSVVGIVHRVRRTHEARSFWSQSNWGLLTRKSSAVKAAVSLTVAIEHRSFAHEPNVSANERQLNSPRTTTPPLSHSAQCGRGTDLCASRRICSAHHSC